MFGKRMMQRKLSRNRKAKMFTGSIRNAKAAQKFPDDQRAERIMYICKVF